VQNWPLPLAVVISGLIDSFNPCAITVLLLFIGLMFSLNKSRKTIIAMGIFYILSVYVTYLLIGMGLMKLIIILDMPHLMAYIGAIIAIVIGLWNLKDYFFPNFGAVLKIPIWARQLISNWSHKATIFAAIIIGFLVGITEFPCSGAIYLAIIGLLSAKTSFLQGLLYLLLYNLMFVLPLIAIFLIASNRLVVEKMTFWSETKGYAMKLSLGIAMIILGVVIFILV
jgi:cytochrome c biogenesis protein CcdA